MAYQNTGYARNMRLTVSKGDYSQDYNICSQIPGTDYAAITPEQFAKLSEADYELRRAAFIAYVYAQESGLQADCPDLAAGSVVYDPVHCQVPSHTQQDD